VIGRSFGRCLCNRLLSGSSMKFTIRSFGCVLRRALFWEQWRRISSLTVGIWRSLRITVFGTYQGASTIMRKAFDSRISKNEFHNRRQFLLSPVSSRPLHVSRIRSLGVKVRLSLCDKISAIFSAPRISGTGQLLPETSLTASRKGSPLCSTSPEWRFWFLLNIE
jgi:hypothetical protein